jgi:hypothetical protein
MDLILFFVGIVSGFVLGFIYRLTQETRRKNRISRESRSNRKRNRFPFEMSLK